MDKVEYKAIEAYMTEKMQDSAHDKHHIYRVLNGALDIANHENNVDTDVLIAACLLHDIAREQQFANPQVCHAQLGGEMALQFLLSRNWPAPKAQHVKDCIATHRFRSNAPPITIEAKILFDADKLEATGLIGIARTLLYQGIVTHPLYILDNTGEIITQKAKGQNGHSFFHEYNFKLKNVYHSFFTARAKAIALQRRQAAIEFHNALHQEITQNHKSGIEALLKSN